MLWFQNVGCCASHSQWWITCTDCIWSLQSFCMLLGSELEWISLRRFWKSYSKEHACEGCCSVQQMARGGEKTAKSEIRIELSFNKDSKSTAYPWVSLGEVIWRSPVLFPVKNCSDKDKKMLISPALVRTWPRWNSRGGFLVEGTREMWYFSPSDLLNGAGCRRV